MNENELSPTQIAEMEAIKKEWADEVEALKGTVGKENTLDSGSDPYTKLGQKYTKRLRAVVEKASK